MGITIHHTIDEMIKTAILPLEKRIAMLEELVSSANAVTIEQIVDEPVVPDRTEEPSFPDEPTKEPPKKQRKTKKKK